MASTSSVIVTLTPGVANDPRMKYVMANQNVTARIDESRKKFETYG